MKKIVYLDMDNVLVDFPSGIARFLDRQETKRTAYGRQRQRLGRDGSTAAYARNIVSVRREKCDISYLF